MVICVPQCFPNAVTATRSDSDAIGHVAILTEDGHIMHSTMSLPRRAMHSMAATSTAAITQKSMPSMRIPRIYKPNDACLAITELQLRNGPRRVPADDSPASTTAATASALLVTSLANGSIHVLELSESGVHRINNACGADDPDNAPSAMHTLSCRGYRMDEEMDVDIDGHHALLAGVTPTGTCDIFRVTVMAKGENMVIGASDVRDRNTALEADIRSFVSVAITSGARIRCDVGGATCCSVGDRFVAVGLSTGAVELYACERILQHSCECALTLSNVEWGYDADFTGANTALSWSYSKTTRTTTPTAVSTLGQSQRQVLAVGTRRGVVSVWSDTGCRLAFFPANGRARSDFDVAVSGCCWSDNGMTLIVCVPGSVGESACATQPADMPSGRDTTLYRSCIIELSFAISIDALSYLSESAAATNVPIEITRVSHASTADEGVRANQTTTSSTHVLLGCDRLILIGDSVCPSRHDASAIRHVHVCAPASYVELNAPLVVASVSPGGGHVAVAGQKGFAVYNIRAGKWTMFGDIVQEKSIVVSSLAWMSDSLICAAVQSTPKAAAAAAGADTVGGEGLLCFYPRAHLNESRVLHREHLPFMPVAMKAYGHYFAVSFDARVQRFAVYRATTVGSSTASAASTTMAVEKGVDLRLRVELVYHVDRTHVPPLTSAGIVDIALMCCESDARRKEDAEDRGRSNNIVNAASNALPSARSESKLWLFGWGERSEQVDAQSTLPPTEGSDASPMPDYLLALTTRGDLVAHHLPTATDIAIATDVHSAFIPRPNEKTRDICEPLWTYSRAGVRATSVQSRDDSYASSSKFQLDFDNEVQPLGMSTPRHRLVGVVASASLQHSASSFLPCFTCSIRTQSVVPNLILMLLYRLDEEPAYRLASKSQDAHEFPMWMELALYGALEYDDDHRDEDVGSTDSTTIRSASISSAAAAGEGSRAAREATTMVRRVVVLLQRLSPASLSMSTVVGVARKTDPRLWPRLFGAAGQPSDLFERCLHEQQHGSPSDTEFALGAAANLVRVIEHFEGSSVAQEKALLVLERLLDAEQYQKSTEIIVFLVRCGHDASCLRLDAQQQLMLARAMPTVTSAPTSSGLSTAFNSLWSFMGSSAVGGSANFKKKVSSDGLGATLRAHIARLLLSLRLRRLHRMATVCDVCMESILREDASHRDMTQALLVVRATLAAEPALRDELHFGLMQNAFLDEERWRDVFVACLAQIVEGENEATTDMTTLSLESESGESDGVETSSDSVSDGNATSLHAHSVEVSIAQSLTQSLV